MVFHDIIRFGATSIAEIKNYVVKRAWARAIRIQVVVIKKRGVTFDAPLDMLLELPHISYFLFEIFGDFYWDMTMVNHFVVYNTNLGVACS